MTTIEKGLSRARARATVLHSVDGAEELGRDSVQEATRPLDFERLESLRLSPRVLARNRIVVDEVSGASAAYKMLRTRVLQRMQRNGWKTIAVTGTCPDEGKSLTAINLSVSLARNLGTTVVLVDMDLRKPSLHRHLGVMSEYSVSDYLRGQVGLEKVAVRPGIERLVVMLNDRPIGDSSEMLTAPQTATLVQRVKHGDGRIAIFDLPPVLASDDMLAFCPLVDAVLLVVAQGKTKQADMIAARELLRNVSIVGAVLNRSSEDVAPYYYYYGRR